MTNTEEPLTLEFLVRRFFTPMMRRIEELESKINHVEHLAKTTRRDLKKLAWDEHERVISDENLRG